MGGLGRQDRGTRLWRRRGSPEVKILEMKQSHMSQGYPCGNTMRIGNRLEGRVCGVAMGKQHNAHVLERWLLSKEDDVTYEEASGGQETKMSQG